MLWICSIHQGLMSEKVPAATGALPEGTAVAGFHKDWATDRITASFSWDLAFVSASWRSCVIAARVAAIGAGGVSRVSGR